MAPGKNARAPWRAILFIIGLLAACAAVIGVTGSIARVYGGGIESAVVRTGTATGLRCHHDAWSFGLGWVCTATTMTLPAVTLPPGVRAAGPDSAILASSDLTGRDVDVTTHLPTEWQAAGGRFSPTPYEVIVVEGHPVGSSGWNAFRILTGPAIFVVALALAFVLSKPRRPSGRRRPRG